MSDNVDDWKDWEEERPKDKDLVAGGGSFDEKVCPPGEERREYGNKSVSNKGMWASLGL